jgi:hypothetical protein
MSKALALALVLVFLTASSTILAIPVSGVSVVENSWVELASMNIARAWLGVAAVNGKIYAIGGSTASGFEPASFPYGNINADHFVGTNEEYDPTNNTWSYKAPMPTPRMSFAIAVIQGKIYCMGGRSVAGDMSGGYTSVNEVYDPVTDTWGSKAPMPFANGWIEAKVIDDKIYIRNSLPNTSGINYVYDPTSDRWNSSVPTPQDGKLLLDYIPNGYETTGIMSPKMVYTFNRDFSSNVDVYNPENDSWKNGVPRPLERYGFGVAVANDIFYVVGGYTYSFIGNFAPLTANEEYIPLGYGTPDSTYVLEHAPPEMTFESPLNQTYNDSSIPLSFTVNKNVTMASYSLDGQQNITITGNNSILNVPNGFHNLTIYANDTFGNVGSQTIYFMVDKPPSLTFGNTIVIAVIAIPVVVVCLIAGLVLYRRHRKNISQNKPNV